jgi:hypothetical protein
MAAYGFPGFGGNREVEMLAILLDRPDQRDDFEVPGALGRTRLIGEADGRFRERTDCAQNYGGLDMTGSHVGLDRLEKVIPRAKAEDMNAHVVCRKRFVARGELLDPITRVRDGGGALPQGGHCESQDGTNDYKDSHRVLP